MTLNILGMTQAEYDHIQALGEAAQAKADRERPRCHFTVMEWHDCDSNPSYSGYQCKHCGHMKDA
jgi:hypothetical protein